MNANPDPLESRYAILLIPDEDGSWFAQIPDLPGCMTVGDSAQDALTMIEDAKRTWISGSLEAGDPIPEPKLVAMP